MPGGFPSCCPEKSTTGAATRWLSRGSLCPFRRGGGTSCDWIPFAERRDVTVGPTRENQNHRGGDAAVQSLRPS